MLVVDKLIKRFGKAIAIDGVSFSIEKGDSFGLLGPNGAGKTTTISIIAGTIDADGGKASLDGALIGSNHPEAKRRIGFVPQDLALFDDISARANLRFFAALYGLFGVESERAQDSVLELVNLKDRADDQVRHFSGGMKRRLNIAAGLLNNPELLILDEPTVGVDPQSRNAIFETLLNLRDQGHTLLYTTHYMEEVERLCRHVAIMDHGRIIAQGDIASLKARNDSAQLVIIELDRFPDFTAQTSIPGAETWTAEGLSLTLEIPDLGRGLGRALAFIEDQGLTVVSVKSRQASLEEVFLQLTGKGLRDSVNA